MLGSNALAAPQNVASGNPVKFAVGGLTGGGLDRVAFHLAQGRAHVVQFLGAAPGALSMAGEYFQVKAPMALAVRRYSLDYAIAQAVGDVAVAVVVGAGDRHGAQAAFQHRGRQLRIPGADGGALLVEHADEHEGMFADRVAARADVRPRRRSRPSR